MVTQTSIKKNQQPEKKLLKFIYTSFASFYVAGMVYIFFFARRRWGPFPKRSIHLTPFKEKIIYWQSVTGHTKPENLEFYKDLLGNVLLFIPFPFLLCYIIGIKSYSKLLLFSVIASLFVEIIQYTNNIGVADIDDLLLNTIGASIGLLILHAVYSKSDFYRRNSVLHKNRNTTIKIRFKRKEKSL